MSPKLNDPRHLSLGHVIHCRQSEITQLLLDIGADQNQLYNVNGCTEIYVLPTEAIYYGTPELSHLLFDAGVAIVETPDSP